MHINGAYQDSDLVNSSHLFEEIKNGKDLSKLIRSILIDQKTLGRVASFSYTHPNGFDKILIPIEKNSSGFLRIHIWWASSVAHTREVIHNHQWDFKSRVILGTLRFSIYEADRNGEIFNKYECIANPENLNGMIKRVGTKKLKKVMDITIKKGSEYTLNHNAIHVVHNRLSETTVTLLWQSRFVKDRSLIFSKKPFKMASPRTHFVTPKLRKRFESLLTLLEIEYV